MTVYQLRNKIRNLKEQIEDYEDEIRSCKRKIERKEETLFLVQKKRNMFEEFFYRWKSRIQNTGEEFQNMFFISKFQEDFTEFLEGMEYQRAVEGYGQAVLSLKTEMESLWCHESDLRHAILEKETELESLQKRLRNMEV